MTSEHQLALTFRSHLSCRIAHISFFPVSGSRSLNFWCAGLLCVGPHHSLGVEPREKDKNCGFGLPYTGVQQVPGSDNILGVRRR